MSLVAKTETSDDTDRLIIRGSNRHPDDWLGLEVRVPSDADGIELIMRYAPSERLFPRIYYSVNGSEYSLDEPDRTAPATYGAVRFDTDRWREIANADDITDIKLAILLPARPWFALGLQSIGQVPHA